MRLLCAISRVSVLTLLLTYQFFLCKPSNSGNLEEGVKSQLKNEITIISIFKRQYVF